MSRFAWAGSIIILLLMSYGCRQAPGSGNTVTGQENETEIRGFLPDGAGESVMLEEMGAREYIPMDTVVCDNSGKFNFSFSQQHTSFYVLRYGSSGYITLLLEPGESVDFQGRLEDKEDYSVEGSPGSALLQTLAAKHKEALEALGEIARMNREWMLAPDYRERKQKLDMQFDSITSAFHDYSIGFIHENPSSPSILIALYNLYGQGIPVFNPGRDFPIYLFVDSVMMASHPDLEAVRLLHAQVSEARLALEGDVESSWLKKGEIAPDFVSSRPDGTELALTSLRGNYVLLAFWASWSNMCREENSILRKAFERYRDMNFRILQVSVDDSKAAWTGAIKEDGLNWDQVSDLRRWDSPVVDLYGVEKIPYHILIDPAGKIVAKDLYGDQLLHELDQIFNMENE